MAIEFKKNGLILTDVIGVEEAEKLLEWLQEKTAVKIDLSRCTHIHPANLQVLIASKQKIAVWPKDEQLRGWLESVL